MSPSCKSGEPWTLPKPEVGSGHWSIPFCLGVRQHQHALHAIIRYYTYSSSHAFCLLVCVYVCVFYICYCGVLLCFIFVWKLKGSIQSKEMNAMHCNATQVQCNTKCEAMCKYVDRCIRTYVSNPISKPSNIINILRIY